jgi:hypothetical protein
VGAGVAVNELRWVVYYHNEDDDRNLPIALCECEEVAELVADELVDSFIEWTWQ